MFSAQVKALMQQLADLLTKRVDAEDGGPGSGNWGHKGRPGQVGGSGKGGGNQYRGGKAGILYTSSKSDWLNGLTGEKQNKASKFMQSMEKLKKPGQSTEAFIMENGTSETGASAVKEYLDLKGEARGWDKYAKRLMDENLDENDKKIVNALTLKYGIMYKGNATLPDPVGMEGDDLRTWNDLKSKAMGGPTSGLEPSDELMITAGLKEAPKAKAPTTEEENDHWMDGLSKEEQTRLKGLLGLDENSRRTLTTAEQIFTMGAMTQQDMSTFNQYLSEKANVLDVDYFGSIMSGKGTGFLSDEQAKVIADALQTKLDEINLRDGTNLTLPEAGDKVEQEILTAHDASGFTSYFYNKHKQSYLELKAYALGADPRLQSHVDYDLKAVTDWRNDIKKSLEGKRAVADAKKLFASKTPEEREDILEATRSSEDVGKALVKTGLMPKDAKINLQGVDHSLALSAAYSYNKVAEKFPFMAGEWHELQAVKLDDNTYAQAFSYSARREIDLNTKHFDDWRKMRSTYEHDLMSGFHPKGTDYTAVVTHEIGHTLDGYLTNKGVAGSRFEIAQSTGKIKKGVSFASILKKRVLKEMKIPTSDKKNQDIIAWDLSKYGTKNEQEWFAECFAEAIHSPNPRPMAATMMKHLTQILKEEGLING